MIQGIKLNQKEFTEIEAEITDILKPLNDFTSPRYQTKGIETNDGLFILIKPKQQVFIECLKPLNITWQNIEKSEIKIDDF